MHGQISEETLLTEENQLCTKVFNIIEPLIVLFNEVNNLCEMAAAALTPYTDPQIINLGIQLIKNMQDFEKGLTTWYKLLLPNQTWINFKQHFSAAQDSLCKVQGPTMQSRVSNQQANFLSNKIMPEFQQERTEYLNAVSASKERIFQALNANTPPLSEEVSEIINPLKPSANASVLNKVVLEMLKLLKEIKNNMKPQSK